MAAPTISSTDSVNTRYALSFDGVDDYVDAGNGASLNITEALTLEAWIKITAFTNNPAVIVQKYSGVYGYNFDIYTQGPRFLIRDSSGTRYDAPYPPTLSLNTWYHLVVTYQTGGSFYSYVNGVQYGPTSASSLPIGTSVTPLRIGSYNDVTRIFNGLIDEVRIYNRALSAAEVLASYQDQYVDSTGLVGKWDMDEGTGTTTADTSGNSNTGTLTNGVAWKVKPPFIQGISTITF